MAYRLTQITTDCTLVLVARRAELLPESREIVTQSSTPGSGKPISVMSPHGTSPDKTRGIAEGIARKQSRAPQPARRRTVAVCPRPACNSVLPDVRGGRGGLEKKKNVNCE